MDYPPEYAFAFSLLDGVRKVNTYWMAVCPAHEDRHPSLKVVVGEQGLLLFCEAGCVWESVYYALCVRANKKLVLKPWEGRDGDRRAPRVNRKVVATYPYTDEGGEVLYENVRFEPKDFRLRRPDGKGDWVWNASGVPRVLYGLPKLLEERRRRPQRVALVLEGEADCHLAWELGFCATTTGGVNSFPHADHSPLAGARVVVPFDIDPVNPSTGHSPGFLFGLSVVGCLDPLDCRVKLVELPVGVGEDFGDWARGRGPRGARGALAALAARTPRWGPWGPLWGSATPSRVRQGNNPRGTDSLNCGVTPREK